MRCFYVLKKWSSAKLSLNRDLSLNKKSLNQDCTIPQQTALLCLYLTVQIFELVYTESTKNSTIEITDYFFKESFSFFVDDYDCVLCTVQ